MCFMEHKFSSISTFEMLGEILNRRVFRIEVRSLLVKIARETNT